MHKTDIRIRKMVCRGFTVEICIDGAWQRQLSVDVDTYREARQRAIILCREYGVRGFEVTRYVFIPIARQS